MPGKGTVSNWTKKEHHNLARLKKQGEIFEVSINADFAIQLKKEKEVDMKDVLNSEEIFADVRKGLLASEEKVKQVFGDIDFKEIAKKIIKEGEISLTSEYRQKLRDDKKRQIITTIARNAMDPRTKLPHPSARIEAAMEEAKVTIDEYIDSEEQIDKIVKKLQPIIPIKFEKEEVDVRIPASSAPRAYPEMKKFGKIIKDNWGSDGSWSGIIEIPAGLLQDMIDKLNSMTHGGIEIEVK